MNRKATGNDGEEAAVRHLERLGYSVIDTNVRPFPDMRRGELDIVAWHGEILCFIEVKTRNSRKFDATDAITITKRRQLTKLAVAYMNRHKLTSNICRFDVICIYNNAFNKSTPTVELLTGAFDPVY